MQHDLFPLQSNWEMPTEFPELKGPIAFDTETKDPWLKIKAPSYVKKGIGHIAGIGVACGDFKAYYPIRHEDGGNLPVGKVLRYIDSLMRKPGPKIFANASYDIGWFQDEGLTVNWEDIHDVQIQAPLINENRRSFSLDNLGKDFLGIEKDEALLEQAARQYGWKKQGDIKSNMHRMHSKYVGPYGEQDPWMTLKLWELFTKEIKSQDLEYVYELERKLMPIMLKMKKNGLRVDLDKARQMKDTFRQREIDSIAKLKSISGLKIDPYSPDSCAILFDQAGVKYPKTPTGKPSITADWLENIEHEGGQLIRDARKYQKAYSTFIDSYILDRHIDGRIHANFNQLPSDDGGTVSGRFSSSGPNLQNIPARDPEIGPMIRSLFLPEEGEQWMAADYANQEPRIGVHWAHTCKLDGAEKVVERYRNDPLVSYHKIVQEMLEPYLPEGLHPYKTAKTINLGIAYGMGGAKLCRSLGLPTKWIQHWEDESKMVEIAGDEGQKILDLYDKEVPYIKKLNKLCMNRARSRGYIKTMSGRRCRFPNGFQHKALNRLIQGTAADQTKEAMVKMSDAGHNMILTMHDEIGMSITSLDEARSAAEIMENALPMAVPFVCDVDIGPSWGEAKEVNLKGD